MSGTTTVTTTSLSSLTGMSATIPIGMLNSTPFPQHLLVQAAGTGNTRQLLLHPVNFTTTTRAGSTGQHTRLIQVRQVTVGGQPGVLSFPARFPITMRTVNHHPAAMVNAIQPQDQPPTLVVTAPAATKPPPPPSSDVIIPVAPAVPAATIPSVPNKSTTSGTLPSNGVAVAAEAPEAPASPAKSAEPVATPSADRLLPEVVRVVTPPSSSPSAAADETADVASALVDAHPPLPAMDGDVTAVQVVAVAGRNPVPASTTATDDDDDKLLNDVSAESDVSEFLPCADFMGPGVSPSPCFSLSDSPLGRKTHFSTIFDLFVNYSI